MNIQDVTRLIVPSAQSLATHITRQTHCFHRSRLRSVCLPHPSATKILVDLIPPLSSETNDSLDKEVGS